MRKAISFCVGADDADGESGNVVTIPILINGIEKTMLLDTGGVVSQLSRKTIAELGLRETESPIQLYGERTRSESAARTSVSKYRHRHPQGQRRIYF